MRLLRSVYDNPAITTDVIVGFPGETQEEFEESKSFLEKISFYENGKEMRLRLFGGKY